MDPLAAFQHLIAERDAGTLGPLGDELDGSQLALLGLILREAGYTCELASHAAFLVGPAGPSIELSTPALKLGGIHGEEVFVDATGLVGADNLIEAFKNRLAASRDMTKTQLDLSGEWKTPTFDLELWRLTKQMSGGAVAKCLDVVPLAAANLRAAHLDAASVKTPEDRSARSRPRI